MEGQSAAKSSYKRLSYNEKDYLIYPDGRLMGLRKPGRGGWYEEGHGRWIVGKIDNVGYHVYCIQVFDDEGNKQSKMVYAHRLVAEHFLENPYGLPYVHHKDENRLNNDVSNLEWVTAKKNMQEHCKKNRQKRILSALDESTIDGEEWRLVPYDSNYMVSNMGRVKNVKTGKLLRLDTSQAYTRIAFFSNKTKHYYLHRLVYTVFTGDEDLDGYVVDHIDSDKRNNRLSNLQKITFSENNARRFKKD